MSEREIRGLLRLICDELDSRVARAGRVARKVVLPTMVGAGLALAGGCDDGRSTVKTDGIIAGVDALYGVDMSMDAGPQPPYQAPDGATKDGVVPMPDLMYMAPDVGSGDAGQLDAGPLPPYTAPDASE